MDLEDKIKKRHRLTLVCVNCKRRKIRCDKGLPCTLCVKSHLSNCEYERPMERPKSEDLDEDARSEIRYLKDKIRILEQFASNEKAKRELHHQTLPPLDITRTTIYSPNCFVGVNPTANSTETIDFHDYDSFIRSTDETKRLNYGPLSWMNLMRRDNGLDLLWKHKLYDKSPCKPPTHTDKVLCKYDLMINKWLTHAAEFKNLPQLTSEVVEAFPPANISWALVDRYFECLYPLLPFLDQNLFERQLLRIIGLRGTSAKVTLSTQDDYATAGLFLVVARMSYLSLLLNSDEDNKRNFEEAPPTSLLGHLGDLPITLKHIQLAQQCLSVLPTSKNITFTTFLLAFHIRLYHRFAPEDGEGLDGEDALVGNAVLIQMCFSFGLHRDPSFFDMEPAISNLRRKLWHFCLFADIYHSITFGHPLAVLNQFYDTKVPFVEEGNNNIRDKTLDALITELYPLNFTCFDELKRILQLVLNVEGKPKVCELAEAINDFEVGFFSCKESFELCLKLDEEYKTKDEPPNPVLDGETAHRIKIYLSFSSFLVLIYFHLYIHYCNCNRNLLFFYLQKAFTYILEIVPHYCRLIRGTGSSTEFLINPTIAGTIHKSMQVVLSVIIKTNFIRRSFKASEPSTDKLQLLSHYKYMNILENFERSLIKMSKIFLNAFAILGTRYFYAWKLYHAHKSVLDTVQQDDFYTANWHVTKAQSLKQPRFTAHQYTRLHSMVDTTLDKTINTTHNECLETFTIDPVADVRWWNYISDNGLKQVCIFDINNS